MKNFPHTEAWVRAKGIYHHHHACAPAALFYYYYKYVKYTSVVH